MNTENKSTTVQTLIFDKKVFKTAKAAKAWAKKHDFKAGAVDETDDSFRLRQREPGEFEDDSFRTITLTKGVKAVIGKLKASKGEGRSKRSVKAQWSDDRMAYQCQSLISVCSLALRGVDAEEAEESSLVEAIEEALICAVCCVSCFGWSDEASLAERIGCCNKLSAACEALLEAVDGNDALDAVRIAAESCLAQCVETAGTEEEEGDGPAHPEDYNEGEGETNMKTAVSRAKLKVKAHWKYGFKVDVRNEADMEAAEMTISGPIGYSYTDETGTSAQEFTDALAEIPTERKVKVFINSEGGSIQDGLKMYNRLKARGEKVTTINDGYALSCASLLLLAGHTRVTPKSSLTMIHTPRIETYGDAEEHKRAIAMLKKHQEMMADVYAEELGITTDEADRMMEAESWFTGKMMADAGWSDQEQQDGEDQQDKESDEDDEGGADNKGEAEGALRRRLVAVSAIHHFNPPEHILKQISARTNAVGDAGSAASNKNQNSMSKETTPVAAAPTADLEKRFNEERKMRITGEINRRAENKVKNEQVTWWIDQAMSAPSAEAEKAVYAQLDALPVAAAPGGAALRPDAPEAKVEEGRPPVFEITPVSGCNARPNKRLPWMEEIRKLKGTVTRAAALSKDWAGRVNYCLELDARENRGVIAANSFSATLVTDFLVDTAITILINRWASLSCFSIEFGPDRYKEYATAQVKFVTAAGSTLKGTKSSPITNFEQGDATVVPISVPMTHYVKSFNVSQEDLMSGLRVENLMKRNLGQLADDVTIDALMPIAGNTAGYASFQQPGPMNSSGALVNFSAGTIHVRAGTFGWNAGQTDGHDLAAMWAYLKKSPEKHLVLDGNFYGRLTNSPGYFQMPFGAEERGGGDRIKTFGWDRLEENTAWPPIVDAAGNAIGGFVCAPQAIVGVTGLPQTPPSIPGAVLQETVVTLPGPDISISMFTWFALSARKLWTSFELMGGFAGGDASAGAVIFNGGGSVS